MFKVYDKVWVFENNKPKEKIIFAVIESMDFNKRDTEIFYHLVDDTVGTGWGNYEGVRYEADKMFNTKNDLINDFLFHS